MTVDGHRPYRIAVDAMGGDHAPRAIVEGAVLAVEEFPLQVILVGQEQAIRPELERFPQALSTIQIQPAADVIEMNETPSQALRRKRNSSVQVALDLVKRGEAQAAVTAGNTGAALAASMLVLRPLKGIDRPAIATFLPTATPKGISILLDAGANVDCRGSQLFQFGLMGSVYAQHALEVESPRVGLLSIGEEDTKGNEASKEAYQLLSKSSLNFIGNIEGKEVFQGKAEVIVCDGFTGNVALKIGESLAEMFEKMLREAFTASWRTKLAYLLVRPHLQAFKKRVDYSEYGGAPLLGVNGICIIGHGRSSAKAIKNAIGLSQRLVEKDLNGCIRAGSELNSELQEAKEPKKRFWRPRKGPTSAS
ncbi:MAG: phosphate acyltransferase PlsX [Candidatus Tectomicrobia bacterium]|uniref:Phosphate acyltransferase n=1 Tax=Tectimicrobiota bacterium TaxID=2528274 RepID=A0A932CRJ2_UNCTE|nr:phosphate acyltransferase PlsX [Candidatus Tectomicrobia bacterium]